jgi:hypothetical protein
LTISKNNSFIFQYTPTYGDDLQLKVQVYNKDINKLYIYLIIYFFLIFSILRIFTNSIVSFLGVILVSANELTYNTLLSAPNWDFLPKLFFLLSLLLILIFVPITDFIKKKTNHPIPTLIIYSITMFTIIYPVFFIHYRFYSPILVILIIVAIKKINVDFNTKLFMTLASIISLLLIKSPEYLESFFVSGFLKSSLLSKIGYSNPQVSLSVVNTDANIQLLIDKDYFKFFEFLGVFSSDIYEKVKFSLNFLLTNNVYFNAPSPNSFVSEYIYGYLFINPASDLTFIFLLVIFGLYLIGFAQKKNYLSLNSQIIFILIFYFGITISFSRYQLNSFYHIQFIFIIIWFKLIQSLFKSNLTFRKNVVLCGVTILLSIIVSFIFSSSLIQKYTLDRLNKRIDKINFEKFQFTTVRNQGQTVYLNLDHNTKLTSFILKIQLKDECNSNIVRIKPTFESFHESLGDSGLKNFEPEWLAIENLGSNHMPKIITGILAPSITKLNSESILRLEGFQTFANDLKCIESLEYNNLDSNSKSLFSYTLILPQANYQNKDLAHLKTRNAELGRSIFDKNLSLNHIPVRDLCNNIRKAPFQNEKFTLISKNLNLKTYLDTSREILSKLELGCSSQGAFLAPISSYDIGNAVRNQVISIKSSSFRGNYIVVLVDRSESNIFKTSEILGKENEIFIPSAGNYSLLVIQVIDDQNSITSILPKLDIYLSPTNNISTSDIGYSKLLPKF